MDGLFHLNLSDILFVHPQDLILAVPQNPPVLLETRQEIVQYFQLLNMLVIFPPLPQQFFQNPSYFPPTILIPQLAVV